MQTLSGCYHSILQNRQCRYLASTVSRLPPKREDPKPDHEISRLKRLERTPTGRSIVKVILMPSVFNIIRVLPPHLRTHPLLQNLLQDRRQEIAGRHGWLRFYTLTKGHATLLSRCRLMKKHPRLGSQAKNCQLQSHQEATNAMYHQYGKHTPQVLLCSVTQQSVNSSSNRRS